LRTLGRWRWAARAEAEGKHAPVHPFGCHEARRSVLVGLVSFADRWDESGQELDGVIATSADPERSEVAVADLSPTGFPVGASTRSEGAKETGRPKERSAMRKVALDLGVRKTAYCEVQDGKVIQRATVTSVETLEAVLGPEQPSAQVAIEACREAWHVHDLLSSWGNQVVLVDTTRSRRLGIGQHGRKTDKIDAEVLALALERGGIPAAHVLSPHRRELRRRLNVRRALVESRAQLTTTSRGLAREQGVRLPKCPTTNFARHVSKLTLQPLEIIAPLLKQLETINAQLEVVDTRLAQLCETEPVVNLLMTAPGVGPIVAASFVSVIDDAKRFGSPHQVESYLGLVPSEDSSGGTRRLGAITKKGNSYLRSLLVQGAWAIITKADRHDPLRLWAEAVAERRTRKIAVIALARRLAGVLWAMWRDSAPYDPALLASASGRGTRKTARTLEAQAAQLTATVRKRVPSEATLQT